MRICNTKSEWLPIAQGVPQGLLDATTMTAIQRFNFNQMKVNPDKFQAIIFGNNYGPSEVTFDVAGIHIPCNSSVRFLGVDIDNNTCFDKHVSSLRIKAARQLNSLQRVAKFLNHETNKLVFNSFIISNFNYCSMVWHNCTTASSMKIEKIQERGLRIEHNDYTSSHNWMIY